jgi:LEA14-like dessication related protein
MSSPVRYGRAVLLALALTAVGACGATAQPYVSVLGAAKAPSDAGQALTVVVEIHNPTRTPLRLSTLDYTVARQGVQSKTRGSLRLGSTIAPGRTETVDIRVPLASNDPVAAVYDLRGRLHGYAGDVQMDWQIATLAQVER